MTTNVLIINRQLVFAVTIKQALEQTGAFSVHPFTVLDAALDYLRANPQHVVLMEVQAGDAAALVQQVRAIQPNVILIVSPALSQAQMNALRVEGSVDMPFTARKIITLIEDALNNVNEVVTAQLPDIELAETAILADPEPEENLPPPVKKDPEPPVTRPLDTAALFGDIFESSPPRPAKMPEFSSLDSVLFQEASGGIFDDIEDGEETPVVNSVVEDVPPANVKPKDKPSQAPPPKPSTLPPTRDFHELVDSMRAAEEPSRLPDRHQQFIEFILTGGMDNLLSEIERAQTETDEPEAPTQTFQKLAEEEPPMPLLEENGTIGDLMVGVSDTGFRNVLELMRGGPDATEPETPSASDVQAAFSRFFDEQVADTETPKKPASLPENKPIKPIKRREAAVPPPTLPEPISETPDDSAIPAQLILETALDESTPVESFSLDDLLDNIERNLHAHQPQVSPLPSWDTVSFPVRPVKPDVSEDAPDYLTEPDFLPEALSDTRPHEPVLTGETVIGEVLIAESDEDTEPHQEDSQPFALTIDESADEQTVMLHAAHSPEGLDISQLAAYEPIVQPVETLDDSDPYIAQIALNLTQVSLELASEATLLTRERDVVAYAGNLAPEEVQELRQIIGDDWDSNLANTDESRVRFITLESNGSDYMLYSRKTAGDFTLSMIFAGETPLRDIRRQGKRLMEALESVPDVVEEPLPDIPAVAHPDAIDDYGIATETDAVELATYAYIWLLRDAELSFDAAVTRAIARGLDEQLGQQGWQVHKVVAQGEYVYVYADVPGEHAGYKVIRDLKRRSAAIAAQWMPSLDPNTLWADSYLIMAPGRDMDEEEIQQFVNFERLL